MKKYTFFDLNLLKTAEALKKAYFKLAMTLHPDCGGDEEKFKILNNEYTELFEKMKDFHEYEGKEYESTKKTCEVPSDFLDIVEALLKLEGLEIEICGRWLWISGESKPHKDVLKSLGCKWARTKQCWTWHFPEDSINRGKKSQTMEVIREKYGSEKVTHVNRGPCLN